MREIELVIKVANVMQDSLNILLQILRLPVARKQRFPIPRPKVSGKIRMLPRPFKLKRCLLKDIVRRYIYLETSSKKELRLETLTNFDGKPCTIICMTHGLFLLVLYAPCVISPLCCLPAKSFS